MRVISVDPVRSKSQNYLGCEQLALRPQTDVALMLALAHTLYEEKLYDTAFITDYTVGFERFYRTCWVRVINSRKMPNGRQKSAG